MKIHVIYVLSIMLLVIICKNASIGQEIGRDVPVLRFFDRELVSPIQYSQDGGKIFRWGLQKVDDNSGEHKHSLVVTRICMNNQEKKAFTFPFEIQEHIRERKGTLNTNPINDAVLVVSPNGKHFVIRLFGGKSMLVCSETGEEVVLPKEKTLRYYDDEIALGFDSSSDLFCGTQCLSPLLVLRDAQTRVTKKTYKFRKMSYPPQISLQPEYWLDKDTSHDNIGILYSVLPSPEDNPDSGVTVLPFTTFQFRFLMAMVVIYDSESSFDYTQTLVDTTRWFQKDKVFLWSVDGRYLAIHDGPQKLQIFDKEKGGITNVCSIYTQSNDPSSYIRQGWFLSNGEIAIAIAGRGNFEKAVIWSPQTREFSEPFFTTTILSVSPKGDFIATATIDRQLLMPFWRNHYVDMAETIDFWSVAEKKKVHTIELKSLSNVYFAPDWSLLETERIGEDNQMVSDVFNLSEILPLQSVNTPEEQSAISAVAEVPTTGMRTWRSWRFVWEENKIKAKFISSDGNVKWCATATVIAPIALYRGRFGEVVAAKPIRHQQTQYGKSPVQHPMQPFFCS